MKFLINASILIVLLISCSEKTEEHSSFFKDVKKLEYNRVLDIEQWKTLYQQQKDIDNKIYLIESLAKVKNDTFVPFLSSIIHSNTSDTVTYSAISALGIIGTKRCEEALIRLPFELDSVQKKEVIIKSLGQCGSKNAYYTILPLLNYTILQKSAFESLALLARKKIAVDSAKQFMKTHIFDNSTALERSYFTYYSSEFADILWIMEQLKATRDFMARKYLLRTLADQYKSESQAFIYFVKSDSLLLSGLKQQLKRTLLSQKAPWKNKFHTLTFFGALADSAELNLLQNFASSDNPHLKLAATKAVSDFNSRGSIPFLLQLITDETDFFIKGEMIKLLCGIDKNLGYQFVMQNLDQGTVGFKELLLDALATIETKQAIQTLHQFILVDESRLNNRAFENLIKIKRVGKSDIEQMLNASNFSSVAMALSYQNKRKRKLDSERLINLYASFNKPKEFEVQREVLNAIETNKIEPDTGYANNLFKNASFYEIRNRVVELYPTFDFSEFNKPDHLELPSFLFVDSLQLKGEDPFVSIETNKGIIKIRLFINQAPLTVQNFLHLSHSNFYNNLTFHRVVPDFVIQGGDPDGNGWGGTPYLIPSELNNLPFKQGSVGIATSGFDTGSSQFFICHSEQTHLNGNYTLFGQVVEGMETVDQIVPGDSIISISVLE